MKNKKDVLVIYDGFNIKSSGYVFWHNDLIEASHRLTKLQQNIIQFLASLDDEPYKPFKAYRIPFKLFNEAFDRNHSNNTLKKSIESLRTKKLRFNDGTDKAFNWIGTINYPINIDKKVPRGFVDIKLNNDLRKFLIGRKIL